MFRLWGRIFKDSHLLRDTVAEDDSDDTRTHKVLHGLSRICADFDLAEPIWFDANISEFAGRSATRFRKENFIEDVDFDYLEIRIIEE